MRHFLHRIGKISLLLIIYGMHTQAYAQVAYQSTNISALLMNQDEKERSLRQVLLEFQQEYEVDIFFTDEIIENKMIKENKIVGGNLEKSLENILMPLGLKYEKIREKVYVVNEDKRQPVKEVQKNSVGTSVDIRTPNYAPAFLSNIPAQLHASSSFAIRISGRVTDENAEGLPGVNIVIKGTAQGTVTDVTGNYAIEVPSNESILVFSSVGYLSKEMQVGNQTSINISLDPDIKSLEEIVVVGYGTEKKSDLTGSIASVKGEEINGLPVRSVTEALQGRVAGVMVNKSSGRPGAASEIIIRGVGSINGLSPLFIIDGVPRANTTNFNPKDVESIEIIKDASAAAIYGAQAAGGVVLITTKKGSYNQKTNIDFTSSVGVRQISNSYKMLETDDYIRARRGVGEDYSLWRNENLPNTNWFDELFESGMEQSYLLSISGGSDKAKYYLSGGYEREDGIQKGNYWERYSLRVNADYKLNQRITVGHQLYMAKVGENPATLSVPWRTLPYMPVYNEDGSFASVPGEVEFSGSNPVGDLAYRHFKSRDLVMNGVLYANWAITDDLDFKVTAAGGYGAGYNDNFTEANSLARTSYNETYAKSSSYSEAYTLNSTLTYSKLFGQKHDFKIMAGYEIKRSHASSLSANATDFPVQVAESFALSTNLNKTASGALSYGRFLSQFGRLNYIYDNRYIITANVRRDGSPKFGPENRWGVFPSVSGGWKINEEAFFQNWNLGFVDLLKPRVSWGILGNDQALGNFAYQTSYRQVTLHSFDEVNKLGGFNAVKVVNESIKWEEIHTTNVGIDLSMFQGRVSATADFYRRNTKDMIYNLPVPLSSGIGNVNSNPSTMPVNIGSILNKGWELSVTYKDNLGPLNFSVSGNVSHNENEVLDLGLPTAYIYSGGAWPIGNNSSPFKTEQGKSVGQLYGFIADGIIQNEAEIDALNSKASEIAGTPTFYNHQFTGAGDLRFRDLDGDGRITADDRTFIGNPWPKYQYGFNLTLGWNGFDFSADIVGVTGRDVMNDVKAFQQNFQQDFQSTYDIFGASFFLENGLTDQPRLGLLDPNGSGAYIEDPNRNYRFYSTYLVEDGSYFKIKNIRVGYTFPEALVNKIGLENLRLYFVGQNLVTFTKFSGLDPEFSNDVKNHGQYNISTYPQTQLISFGVELGF